ncbi:MAG: ABC transporter substrate-binding protein [Anaerolineae bacterium]|nr:ABC transporter substrate-binding protein [Anaerolineae bacterium]
MSQRMNRREFLRVSASVAAGAALAACAPPAAQPAKEAEKPAGKTAPTPAEKKITVKFMNWWGAEREAIMNEVIARFEEEHPDIEVVNAVQPWDNRAERAATAIASRNPPAVIMTPRVETYKFAHEGLIIPITEYVKASGLNVDEIFYEGEINNQRWEGELWAFPLPTAGGATGQYLYNKKLLSKAGFDPEKPPETWQELEQVAKAVTVLDEAGIQVLGADVGNFPAWLYTNNGKYCTDDARKLTFNSPEGVETLEWMVKFTNEINGGIENVNDFWEGTSDTSADFPFYTDRVAIWFTGVWAFGHLKTWDPELWKDTNSWGAALRPYNGNNPKAAHHGVSGLQWAWGYVIPKNLPKEVQDAAYKWVEFLGTDPRGGCYFLFKQGRPSPVKKCNENPEYYKANPYWDVVLKSLESDVSVPITPVQSQIDDILNQAIQEAFYGKKDPKEALDWAAEKGQAVLDKFWSGS